MGQGFLGSIGHGDFHDRSTPESLETLRGQRITTISAGWAHSALTTESGRVFLFGRTHGFPNTLRFTNMQRAIPWFVSFLNRIAGHFSVESLYPAEVVLPNNEKAVQVSASAALTMIRSSVGNLYAIGSNSHGQCGIGTDKQLHAWNPERVKGLDGEKVIDVAAGFQHVVVATDSGKVFAFGKGLRGQLGMGEDDLTSATALDIMSSSSVLKVGAGLNHSVCLMKDGKMFLWGKLMGLPIEGRTGNDQTWPRELQVDGKVIKMSTSQFHTMFLTDEGRLFIVGRTKHYTKRNGDSFFPVHARTLPEPEEIPIGSMIEDPVRDIAKLFRGMYTTGILLGKLLFSNFWLNSFEKLTGHSWNGTWNSEFKR